MLDLIICTDILSMCFSAFGLFYINKYTHGFGPKKTLNLIFSGFFLAGVFHLSPYKDFIHNNHTIILAIMQLTIIVTYIIEVRLIKFQGDWLPSDILNNLPDMLWIKDKEGRFLYANNSICNNLLLLRKQNVIGKTESDITTINNSKGLEYTFGEIRTDSDNVILTGNTSRRFLEIGKVNGKFLAIQVIKTPIFDKNGDIKGIVGCGRDLTYDLKDHVKLQKLYDEKNYEDFEKLFEEHKYRHLLTERTQCTHCTSFEDTIKI